MWKQSWRKKNTLGSNSIQKQIKKQKGDKDGWEKNEKIQMDSSCRTFMDRLREILKKNSTKKKNKS